MVHNNKILKNGVHKDLPIVLDIEDKITAKELSYDIENIIEFTKNSLDSRIGEISNCASSYVNKYAKDEETKKRYDDNCCLLSVINGKEIDYAKTGVRWNVPTKISKYAKPLPYFLKYKYPKQNKHNMSKTKMNEHCWFIEKWERNLRFNNDFINTSYCMIDNNIDFNQTNYDKVVELFDRCRREYKHLKDEERMARNFNNYKDFFVGLSKFEVENTNYDWDSFYNSYRKEFECICNQNELTNYLTELIYNKLNGSYYNILWEICKKGILENLKKNKVRPILVPVESDDNVGTEYLGKYYKLVEYKGEI